VSPEALAPVAVPKPLPASREGVAGGALKRALDLIVAVVLLAVSAPLFLALAVLIKLDSPGPVLYRSRRIGREGIPFEMLKFRTMFDGADAMREALRPLNEASNGFFKLASDPRTTRVGRVLRSTCLDELPQLLQVLTGKMSLVGPRPLVPEESGRIPPTSPRFAARPGITGPWQLGGSWQIPIPEMIEMDAAYLDQWSVWLDLKLLCRTALYAARRGGV
jgi:lipopolysaccharide/colanic/teichoic acid biosynthesis glycosyltransferase